MPSELPIACSLDATALSARVAAMAELGRDALVDASRAAGHAELRFDGRDGIRERVAAIVAAEAQCCPFLDMEVRDEPGVVVLDIGAPAEADLVLGELVAAFTRGA